MLNISLVFPFLSTVFRFKGSDQKMNLSKQILKLKERLVTSSTHFFFFHDLGNYQQKEKEGMREIMYIYIYMFLVCICCFVLWYLPKLKRGMAPAFHADFLYMFYMKMFLTKYHISWPSSCIRPNFLIKKSVFLKCIFKFFFSQLMTW